MTDDLKVLFPEGKTVDVSGESITLKPFTFGQLPKVMTMISPIVKQMNQSGVAGATTALATIESWVDLFAAGGEGVISFMAWATGKPREWFDVLSMDEGVVLMQTIIEVNSDFFVRRILPLIMPPAPVPEVVPEAVTQDGEQSSAS
ncbi:MAG: DUF6631 family protein [Burkholderiales bacterium]